MDYLQKLKQVVFLLLPFSEIEWNEIAGKLICRDYHKGDFLIKEGQVEKSIYFLNNGATRDFFLKDGKEFTVDFHFEGEFVTSYYSLITNEPSLIFIELLEDASVIQIPYHYLVEFYQKYPQKEKLGRLMAESQYVQRLQKQMDLLSLTAEERYAQLMSKNPSLISSISVKHLASYLGIQPESLSRIRKSFNKN